MPSFTRRSSSFVAALSLAAALFVAAAPSPALAQEKWLELSIPDGLSDQTGGGLAIRNATGEVLDAFGYGTATNIYIEGTRAAASTRGNSMARIPHMADTENNSADIRAAVATPGRENF